MTKLEEKPKKPETPKMSTPELIAADLLGAEGGDKRQRALDALSKAVASARSEGDLAEALLHEFTGDAPSMAAKEAAERELAQERARRDQAFDGLAAEKLALEKALKEGTAAVANLGEKNATSAFHASEQGKQVIAQLSRLGHALMRAGQQGRQPPEPVAKAIQGYTFAPSQKMQTLEARITEVTKALRVTRTEAISKIRELDPDVCKAALNEPLALPGEGTIAKVLRETIAKDAGSVGRQWEREIAARHDEEVRKRDAAMARAQDEARKREAAITRAQSITKALKDGPICGVMQCAVVKNKTSMSDLLEAIAQLPEEQKAQLRAAVETASPKSETEKAQLTLSELMEQVLALTGDDWQKAVQALAKAKTDGAGLNKRRSGIVDATVSIFERRT